MMEDCYTSSERWGLRDLATCECIPPSRRYWMQWMTMENIFSTVCQYDVLDVCLRPSRPAAAREPSRHWDQQSATHSLLHRYLQILTVRTHRTKHSRYSTRHADNNAENIRDVCGNIVNIYRVGRSEFFWVILPIDIFCFKRCRFVVASICPAQTMTFQNFMHKTSFLVC